MIISSPYSNIRRKKETMQQAIPYKSWLPLYTKDKPLNPPPEPIGNIGNGKGSNVNVVVVVPSQQLPKGSPRNMDHVVSENSVIVFARRGCCMSHVMKRLLLGLGVNPAVYEIDEEEESSVLKELELMVIANDHETGRGGDQKKVQLPAVFIGGKLFGGLDRVMATHISGELVPVLKQAGALWL